jgi:hypothetical protein
MSYELVRVTYQWKDDVTQEYSGVVCIGEGPLKWGKDDEEIFFYCRDNQDLALLTEPNNGEEFVVIAIEGE